MKKAIKKFTRFEVIVPTLLIAFGILFILGFVGTVSQNKDNIKNAKLIKYGVVKSTKFLKGSISVFPKTIIEFIDGYKFTVDEHIDFDKKCCKIFRYKHSAQASYR